MVPYEAFLSGKPVVTTIDAGGPLEVVARPRDRARRRAGAVRRSRRRAPTSRASRRRGEAVGRSRSRRSPSGSPGTPASTLCSREGRLLLAAAAVALGDRRLLRRCSCRRCASESRGRGRRAGQAGPRGGRRPLPHRQRPRGARLDRRCPRERPGVVVLHEYVLHHLIAGITIGRGNGRGVPRRDGARARRRRPAARRSACSTTCCRCSGRPSRSASRSRASSSTWRAA